MNMNDVCELFQNRLNLPYWHVSTGSIMDSVLITGCFEPIENCTNRILENSDVYFKIHITSASRYWNGTDALTAERISGMKFRKTTGKTPQEILQRVERWIQKQMEALLIKVSYIEWDTEEEDLPQEVEYPLSDFDFTDLDESIGDRLSNDYGFCHRGFHYSIRRK